MKKLVNDAGTVVREMLEGAVALAPGQALLSGETVVVRREAALGARDRVAVLSGGGSGHEPAHAGYVGEGMLAAAVAGNVFTSPSVDAVLAGLRAVGGPAGALLIVKNYTGDRLNFGLAAEIARAEGVPVEVVVVADDVSLTDRVPRDRRRGIAGTILVHKVAGAAAAAGLPLGDVARVARRAADAVGSMGVGLSGCTLPGASRGGFVLADDEVELGLGIHGEPGVTRTAMRAADGLVAALLDAIVADHATAPARLEAGDRVALLVNGLGGTPPMELDVVLRAALSYLGARRIKVARAWSGTLLSALDMQGVSLSVMRLDDELLGMLDAPTDAPAWPGTGQINSDPVLHTPAAAVVSPPTEAASVAGLAVREVAFAAAHALLAAEAKLTDLDTRTGDGDLGLSMARAARAVLELPEPAFRTPASGLTAMSETLRRVVGGSSGPFYAIALLRAARHLAGNDHPTLVDWAAAFGQAVDGVGELGGAMPGDRTMLDALHPARAALAEAAPSNASVPEAVAAAAAAAAAGAAATASMRPRLGRSSYLGERALGIPDGGAVAVQVWFSAIATTMTSGPALGRCCSDPAIGGSSGPA